MFILGKSILHTKLPGDEPRHFKKREHKKRNGEDENRKRYNPARKQTFLPFLPKAQNGTMLEPAETKTQKTGIWRAAVDRAFNKINTKISELLEQVKETDRRAEVLNKGFYNSINATSKSFYSDFAAMNKESANRTAGFANKVHSEKFANDLITLNKENEKRNVGFHCNKKATEMHNTQFKKMCEESCRRDDIYKNRKANTGLDRMKMLNERRTASFIASRRSDSKYDAVMKINENRYEGFRNKKPVTKLEEITKWNCQRNATFNLHA